jgi:hypothetical protein
MVEIAYIRGGQIRFIVIPDMLKNAPFFDRFKMWRKFKGHAVRGLATPVEPIRGGRGFGGRGGGTSRGGGDNRPPQGRGTGAVVPSWQQQQQAPTGPAGRGMSAVVPAWQQQQARPVGGPGLGHNNVNPYTSGGSSAGGGSQSRGYGNSGPSVYGAGR